jgi:transcriptional regulator with XRE-family HTH domain
MGDSAITTAVIVGGNIRRSRQRRRWTQRELAERIGDRGGPRNVNLWENGHKEPSSKYRHALARVLFDGDLSALYRDPGSSAEKPRQEEAAPC